MNFIAAMLLTALDMAEEETFWMLTVIVEELLPAEYYTRSMLASQIDQRVLQSLVAVHLPKINQHLVAHRLQIPLVSTQWFLCLYVGSLPTEVRSSALAFRRYADWHRCRVHPDESSGVGCVLQRGQQDSVSRGPGAAPAARECHSQDDRLRRHVLLAPRRAAVCLRLRSAA
jgi:hypothetical protein